jgi:hypothetical protein
MLEEVTHMPCEWKTKLSPQKQKFYLDISKGKVILEVFFDAQGLIHYEYFTVGHSVNKEMYVKILRHLRDPVRRKHTEKCENSQFLLHDNSPVPCQAQCDGLEASAIV